MQVGNKIITHLDPYLVMSANPLCPLKWWQLIQLLNFPLHWQPQVTSSANVLLEHQLTQGVTALDNLKIHTAEKPFNVGIWQG